MPTFDYRCKKCEATFEASVPFGSKKAPACSACGSKSVEKLLTPPLGIHFKGSGFYKTDSAVTKDIKPSSAPKSTQTPKTKE